MTTRTRPKIKQTKHLTLRDRLSRLNYVRACQLLGPSGAQLIRLGSNYEIDIQRDVYLRGDLFRVKFPSASGGKDTVATITTMAAARNRLKFNCTACETLCEHVGAAVSLVLEEKTALGLAAPPDENRPLELLSESELVEHALRERQERAKGEKFRISSSDAAKPWTDYTVASALSGKTYRVALRGEERGQSYCSCPDFRTNTLGTCKHVRGNSILIPPRPAARFARQPPAPAIFTGHNRPGRTRAIPGPTSRPSPPAPASAFNPLASRPAPAIIPAHHRPDRNASPATVPLT